MGGESGNRDKSLSGKNQAQELNEKSGPNKMEKMVKIMGLTIFTDSHILHLTEAPAPLYEVSQGALFSALFRRRHCSGDKNGFKKTNHFSGASKSAC
ncbi:MAG: hypothetical protein LUI87_18195 [Lachnospiraceae bacterium]|nr:hypothetical protein [Lachnospiraceae bacterium]